MPFLRQNYSFGYFRHVRIYLLGMVVSIQRYLRGLSASKKSSTLTLRDCSIAILGALGMSWQISTQSYIAKLSTILVLLSLYMLKSWPYIKSFFTKRLLKNSVIWLVIWACMTMPTKNRDINLQKTWKFICIQKINYFPFWKCR